MKLSVIVDFDETVTKQNVAHYLFNRFAPQLTQKYRSLYKDGLITFREYQEKGFNALHQPLDIISAVVKSQIDIRDGFVEMVDYLKSINAQITIASVGLDFYIDPVLQSIGLNDLNKQYAIGKLSDKNNYSFCFEYPDLTEKCDGDWGVCKCEVIAKQEEDIFTIFVGDGLGADVCISQKVDCVFARGKLLEHCKINDIPVLKFDKFTPIVEFIDKWTKETDGLKI